MESEPNQGWLPQARRCWSDNQDERPDQQDISLLVIHCISLPPDVYGGDYIERFFTNQLPVADHCYFSEIAELRVSAHLLIDRQGAMVQFVPFHRRAWHAGLSCYAGREKCNDFSIGIELEGSDHYSYSEAQYHSLAQATTALCATYPALTPQTIVGHSDIAPGRKTDPGPGFDWDYYRGLLTQVECS